MEISNTEVDAEPTGKEIFAQFLEKYEQISKDDLAETRLSLEKLRRRFNKASETYTNSNSFKKLLLEVMDKEDTMSLQLKSVSDELHRNKKVQVDSDSISDDGSDQELNCETLQQVKNLENQLSELNLRIQELEKEEVNLSDEDNSAYIQVTEYRQRFCTVFQELCELRKTEADAERVSKKRIEFSGTKIPQVNRAIEEFYNERREFPNYLDILTVIKKANKVEKLHLSSAEINKIAPDAFEKLGEMVQKYRQMDDDEILSSYISSNEEDPASKNVELENTLKENQERYRHRINELIETYAKMVSDETDTDSDSDSEEDIESDESENEQSTVETDTKSTSFRSLSNHNVEQSKRSNERAEMFLKKGSLPRVDSKVSLESDSESDSPKITKKEMAFDDSISKNKSFYCTGPLRTFQFDDSISK